MERSRFAFCSWLSLFVMTQCLSDLVETSVLVLDLIADHVMETVKLLILLG